MVADTHPQLDPTEFRDCLSRALGHLLQVPGVWYQIGEIEFIPERAPTTGRAYTIVRVPVATNNRALVLGQFLGFPVGGLRGYHPNYVFGYVHGYYDGRHGVDLWNGFQIVLDVSEQDGASPGLYRYLTVEQAVAEGLLRVASPLWTSMRRYDLRYVLVSGSVVSGPSHSMIKAVAQAVENYGITSVADVYAGTCSLAKVACAHGVTSAVCVDPGLDLENATRNLGEYASRCELVAQDARSFNWHAAVDLLIVDPFYEFALEALRHVVARLMGRFRYLLFNLGSPVERDWLARIVRELDGMGLPPLSTFPYGEQIVLCQPPA